MVSFLSVSDLLVFAPELSEDKANAMIEDATAMAVLAAPCITDEAFTNALAVRAILRGAILRWNDAGTGAVTAQAAGPFSQSLDTRQERKGMFWPSEIVALQSLCLTSNVYSTSLAGPDPVVSVTDGWL